MQKRSIFLYGLAFLAFLTVAVIRNRSFDQMHRFTHDVEHSREVIIHLETLSNDFKSAELYSKYYEGIASKTYYQLARTQASQIPDELKRLRELFSTDSASLAKLDTIAGIINRNIDALMQMNLAELIAAGRGASLDEFYRAESMMQEMIHHASALSNARRDKLDAKILAVNTLSIILSLAGIAMITFTFLTNQREYRRRLQLEGFLESVLNTSQAGIISLSAMRNQKGAIQDFRIDYANPAFERLTGLAISRLPGQRMSEVPLLVRAQLLDRFTEVVNTGQAVDFEKEFGKRWYFVSLARKGDGVTASFQDISALRQYQKELEASIHQLERSNAELEEYAYVASHDLQEPLRKIQTFANYIWERKQQVFDAKEQQYFQKLVAAAHRMSTLVRDLLSISGLRKKPDFINTDLNQLLAAAVQDLDLLIAQKEAVLHIGTLPHIDAVPLQMQQLLYNLVQNALKFTVPGRKPEITVSSRVLHASEAAAFKTLPQDKSYVALSVCDNGIGFNNDQAKQIFGLFKRLHVHELYPGSGIGLTLCQRIAENHHGIIYASGEQNKGACFFVVLPERQN